jgi:hypothetical protein
MRLNIMRFLTFILIVSSFTISCTPKMKYERQLKRELESGVRYDSLFMGLYLGMTQKDFYTHCWNLNRKGLVKQGPDNRTVEYQMRKELKYPAAMNFYPNFKDGKIAEMPVKYSYTGWAPWNKKLSSDSLQLAVLKLYKQKYGNHFIVIRHPKRGNAYVQIKGNRRITIFKENDMTVWAILSDMLVIKDTEIKTDAVQIPSDSSNVSK